MKRIIAILAAVLILTSVLAACGKEEEKKEDATPDSAVADSATKDSADPAADKTELIETKEDGSTVEKDAEGNVITIDKDREIVSIKDKDGNKVDVREYVTTHYIVTSDGTAFGDAGNVAEKPTVGGSASSKPAGASSKPQSSTSKPDSDASSKPQSSSSQTGGSTSSAVDSSSSSAASGASSSPGISPPVDDEEYELPII